MVCLVVARLLRKFTRPGPTANIVAHGMPVIGDLETGFLADGPARACDVAVVALLAREAVRIDTDQQTIVATGNNPAMPTLLMNMRNLLQNPARRDRLPKLFAPVMARLHDAMAERGLVLTQAQAASVAYRAALPVLLLAMFGLARTVLGMLHNKPIGLIALLTAVTLFAALAECLYRPLRIRLGDAVLADVRATNSRLMRAPQDGELTIAMALAGGAVLAGTQFDSYRCLRSAGGSDGSGSSSDSGGSDSSGNDSGGSDGGGSGCGGCSS